MNSRKKIEQRSAQENEVYTRRPQVDNLSQQIVDLMEERKNELIHERLYKKGKEKLLNITKDAISKNSASMRELEHTRTVSRGGSRANNSSLDMSNHRVQQLYDLSKGKQAMLQRMKEANERLTQNKIDSTKYSNEQSQKFRIDGFIKEFKSKLGQVLQLQNLSSQDGDFNPMDHSLESNEVISIMHEMGFLPENPKAEFEKLISDIYVLFRTTPDQKILSDHLLTVLMSITGIFDKEVDVNDGTAKIWQECGFIE